MTFAFIILLYAFSLIYQITYYFRAMLPVFKIREVNASERPEAVSVIICAKDEAENLKTNLPLICEQKYSEFEVLVMDDHSSDESAAIIGGMQVRYPHLRYLKASDGIADHAGKKAAMEEARSQARYDVILVTDADCSPASRHWISLMEGHLGKKSVVLGIGQYRSSGTILNGLIQYETLQTAISFLGFASLHKAYMGLGRNMAYRKSSMRSESARGEELASGDDDLFVQASFDPGDFSWCIDKGAHTFSRPPSDLGTWLTQKSRHYSAARYYRPGIQLRLLIYKSSIYIPNYLVMTLLVLGANELALLLFLMAWFFHLVLLEKNRRKLHFTRPIYFLPCYEIFFSLFDIWTTLQKAKTKDRKWVAQKG